MIFKKYVTFYFLACGHCKVRNCVNREANAREMYVPTLIQCMRPHSTVDTLVQLFAWHFAF